MPQNDLAVFLWYWLLANGAALTLTLYDKRAARQGHWRIPESTLFTVAPLAGALGYAREHAAHPSQNPAQKIHGGSSGDPGATDSHGGACVVLL